MCCMTSQTSFTHSEFAAKNKIVRREKFLSHVEELIPSKPLLAVIEPHYPKGKRGRPPVGIGRMLQVYFLQQWPSLADDALEDALYDSQALQQFARIDFGDDGVPKATTLLSLRRLRETQALWKGFVSSINANLTECGFLLCEGALGDATLIAALASIKNLKKESHLEMHQTKKGNQLYFVMKANIGADRDSKQVNTVVVTAANVADISKTSELLHGAEKQVHADAGCTCVENRAEIVPIDRKIDWQTGGKREVIKAMAEGEAREAIKIVDKAKDSVRAFVEHSFHIVKNLFRHKKVRCRGLAKNGHQLYISCLVAARIYLRPDGLV